MLKRTKLPEATEPCPEEIRGTRAGALWHRATARQQACEECREAEAIYRVEYRAGHVRKRERARVTLPVELLAELYLNCSVEMAEKLDERYGRKQMDEWVAMFDKQESAA